MATQSQHRSQWLHNREFLRSIIHQSDNSDWMTTVAFYTAVHALQTLLCIDGNNRATTHESRWEILHEVRRYDKIRPDYKALYDASRVARYDCSGWLNAESVRDELIARRLSQIEERVVRLGNITIELPPILSG
jgi:hypothetical protein